VTRTVGGTQRREFASPTPLDFYKAWEAMELFAIAEGARK